MAQRPNLAIPARFTFRPYRSRWVPCWAEILGWYEEPEPPPGPKLPSIFAPIPKMHRPLSAEMERFLAREKVLVRLSVPSAEELEDSSWGFYLGTTHTVEINRADIPVEVLPMHETRRNTPDISGREFLILACPNRAFEELFLSLTLKSEGAEKDAWAMRDEFLALEKETVALCLFLSRWGLWNWARGYDGGRILGKPALGFVLAFPNLIWERRDKFASGMAGKPSLWLKTASPLSFTQSNEPPYFNMERSYCEDVIEATISIDHLRNLKYRLCKLEDCRKPYRVKTKQRRMYCSTKCAHLANVRKLRAEKKKAQSKRSKHAKGKS